MLEMETAGVTIEDGAMVWKLSDRERALVNSLGIPKEVDAW